MIATQKQKNRGNVFAFLEAIHCIVFAIVNALLAVYRLVILARILYACKPANPI